MVFAPIVFFLLEEGYVKMYLKGRPVTMYMPKDQVDSYCLESRGELPSNKLKLDWVYPFEKLSAEIQSDCETCLCVSVYLLKCWVFTLMMMMISAAWSWK